jgi:hypothetical protein
MAASDYVPIFFNYRLHLAGRPQMSTRPNSRPLLYEARNANEPDHIPIAAEAKRSASLIDLDHDFTRELAGLRLVSNCS